MYYLPFQNKEAKLEAQQTEARDMGLVMDTLREKINKLSEVSDFCSAIRI